MIEGRTSTSITAVGQCQYETLPALAADLVRRQVAIIAAPTLLRVAAAATAAIPIGWDRSDWACCTNCFHKPCSSQF